MCRLTDVYQRFGGTCCPDIQGKIPTQKIQAEVPPKRLYRLKGPCYLSRDDHDRKIRARKQRTDIGRYSFVNRTIKLWNQLPTETLATFPCKSHIFRKRVRKVITSEVK
jgi:hypothetical protein